MKKKCLYGAILLLSLLLTPIQPALGQATQKGVTPHREAGSEWQKTSAVVLERLGSIYVEDRRWTGGTSSGSTLVKHEPYDNELQLRRYTGLQNYQDRWTSNGPYGGGILSLAHHPSDPNIIFAAAGEGYKSTDGGASWNPLTIGVSNYVSSFAIDPNNPDTVYALSDGLYKSVDGGTTWNLVNGLPLDPRNIAIAPSASALAVAFTDGSVFKSLDGGTSWIAISTDGLPSTHHDCIIFHPLDPSVLYACNYYGVFKSSGGAWIQLLDITTSTLTFDQLDSEIIFAGIDAGSGRGGIMRSVDGGDTWIEVLGESQAYSYYVASIVVCPSNPEILYAAGQYAGIFKSTDRGASWFPTSLTYSCHSLGVSPINPNVVFAGTLRGGVWKSSDGGATWTHSSQGLKNGHFNTIVSDPHSPGVLWALGSNVNRGVAGGTAWKVYNRGLWDNSIDSFALDSTHPNILYLVSRTFVESLGLTRDRVFRSTDSGSTWVMMGSPIDAHFSFVAVSPSNPAIVYAVADYYDNAWISGVLRSQDQGLSWTVMGNNGLRIDVPTSWMWFLAINPLNPEIIYAGTTGDGIYRSLDGGDNWVQINDGLPLNSYVRMILIDYSDSNILYSSTDDGVYRSFDGGTTWSSILLSVPSAVLAIDPTNPNVIYAASEDIFRSNDKGMNWVTLHKRGLPPSIYASALALDHSSPNTIYLGVYGGVYSCKYSQNRPPVAEAGFLPLDIKKEDKGLFEIVARATDPDDNLDSVVSVIELPSLEGDITLEVDEEIVIKFEPEKGKVLIKGPDPEALLEEIQEHGGLLVEDGQKINVKITDDSKYKLKFEDDILHMEAPEVTLRVTATDTEGLSHTAKASPSFESGQGASGGEESLVQPEFNLLQNYPNPFNPETTIEYEIEKDCEVTLKVYNLAGKLIKTLVDEYQNAGHYTITWYGSTDAGQEVASGVYFYRIKAGDFVSTKKMVVLK